MTINELRNTLNAKPFVPFIGHVADGTSLPVPHPDFLFVTGGGRTIIVNSTKDDSFTIVDLLLVTRLEVPAPGVNTPNPEESTQKPQ
jgi:hypothetical protein